MESLLRLGWNPSRQKQLETLGEPAFRPARVAVEHRGGYGLVGGPAEVGQLSGRLRHLVGSGADRPAVGDWVAVRTSGALAVIEAVLPRATLLSRRRVGRASAEQVVAANVDVAFVVTSANRDFNLRRLERHLSLVWSSGARPIVVLSKADLCDDLALYEAELRAGAPGVSVITTSAATGRGLDDLRDAIGAGLTAVMIGSSGVGKSSLLNGLLGEGRQTTREIRVVDDKGRHATTRRELFEVGQGCLIDTPGVREVGLWDAAEGTERTFEEVETLAAACRFRDCRHQGEPGCAVRAAAEAGRLDEERLESYERLRREQAFLDRRTDARTQGRTKQRWKAIHKEQRARRKVDPKLRED